VGLVDKRRTIDNLTTINFSDAQIYFGVVAQYGLRRRVSNRCASLRAFSGRKPENRGFKPLARMRVPKLARMVFILFWVLETLLNFAQIHVFFVATSLSGIQETELKSFLTIFGTAMRAILMVSPRETLPTSPKSFNIT